MNNRHTFNKTERISFNREIDCLFKQGETFISYPLRIVYLEQMPNSRAKVSVLINVPKKKIKHAVERNRMKRLIREAYRLNKTSMIEYCNKKEVDLLIAFLFIGKKLYEWEEIEVSMKKVLNIIKERKE